MATPTLSNLGTQSTYKVYICDGDGAKGSSNGILANLQNTTDIRRILLEHAAQNRALVYESTTYGYTNQEISGDASAYKYFLSDASGAEGTVPADALDITPYITNGYKTAVYPDANDLAISATLDSISSGVYTYERRGNIQVLKIDTESNAALDNLYRIVETNSQIADRDILIIVGTSVSRPITINDHSIENSEVVAASQNICLENSQTFVTASTESQRTYGSTTYDKSSLTLMWDATAGLWIEINRAPKSAISRKTLSDNDVIVPVSGTTVVTVASGGGTTTVGDYGSGSTDDGGTRRIASGIDTSIYDFSGTVTTSNNYTVEKPYGSAKEGDSYKAIWRAAWTASSSNKVTIFGKELTAAEASGGATNPVEITTRYVNGSWQTGVKKINSDHFEPTLGNPTTTDMILTSTTAGVRSWATLGALKYKKYTYDFAIHTGAVGTYSLGSDATELLPAKAIIDGAQSFIQVETALTSSGSPTVEVGLDVGSTSGAYLADDTNFFTGATAFGSSPFNAVGDVIKGTANVGQLLSASKVTFTINTAALTAGKVNVFVAYVEAA